MRLILLSGIMAGSLLRHDLPFMAVEPCLPPAIETRPNYLVPGTTWEEVLTSGIVTFESPSPHGLTLSSLSARDYAGRFAVQAVITNGHGTGDTLVGVMTLAPSPAAHIDSSLGRMCNASLCTDTVWIDTSYFALTGYGDAAVAAWPLVATDGVESTDQRHPGIEAAFQRDSMLTFSLGPGLHSEDGPPRFTIVEVRPPLFMGWWSEGAPIEGPAGGHFCLRRLP